MFLVSLQNIIILLLMAVPGYILARTRMLDKEKTVGAISAILLYVCTPAIMINSFIRTEYNPDIALNLAVLFFFTLIFMGGLSFIGKGLFFKEKDSYKRGLYAFCGAFGNVGFLCIPFLKILMPDDLTVILYASCSVVAFNFVAWTIGCYHITGERKYITAKRVFLNPACITFVFVLPLFLLNVNTVRFEVIAPYTEIFASFANIVGPLSMTVLGIKFSDITLKDFKDAKLYAVAAIKLVLSPALALALVLLLSLVMDTTAIRLNIIALAAMPVANNSMLFASVAGKDVTPAARIVLVTTILSVITIPLALTLCM